MKFKGLLTIALLSGVTASYAFDKEIEAGYQNIDVHGYSSTPYATSPVEGSSAYLSGTFYSQPVRAGIVPAAEAGHFSNASSVQISYKRNEKQDLDQVSILNKYDVNRFYVLAGLNYNTKVGKNVPLNTTRYENGIAGGLVALGAKPLDNLTYHVGYSFDQYGIGGSNKKDGQYITNLRFVLPLKAITALSADVGVKYDLSTISYATTTNTYLYRAKGTAHYDARLTGYLTPKLAVGVQGQYVDGKSGLADSSSYGLHGRVYLQDGFNLSLEANHADKNVDFDTIKAAANVQF